MMNHTYRWTDERVLPVTYLHCTFCAKNTWK